MNKTTLITVVLVGIVVAVGGLLVAQGGFLTSDEEVEDVEAALHQAIVEGEGSLECTFEDTFENELGAEGDAHVIEGVAYIRNGDVRINMSMPDMEDRGNDLPEHESYNLLLDNQIWIWNTLEPNGFVITMENGEDNEAAMPQRLDYVSQLTQYNTGCVRTRVSSNHFTVPEDVEFQDFQEFQQQQIEQQQEFMEQMEEGDMEIDFQE